MRSYHFSARTIFSGHLKRVLLHCLAVTALLNLAVTGAKAQITIGAPTNHVNSVPITGLPANVFATSTLIPDPMVRLAPAVAGGLLDTTFTADLAQYPGWTLNFGAALGGTLAVTDYQAKNLGGGVGGARLNATYTPGGADPAVLTYLQVFQQTGTFTANNATHIDPFPRGYTTPFYYTAAEQATFGLNFVDNPSTNSASVLAPSVRTTTFSVYLVDFNLAAKTVTAHDGWTWGYSVVATTPEPGTITMVLCFTLSGSVLALRRRRR
ncbi:MAG: hypothetical protein JWL77_53 [Chthonomonadaceae bacterium]|nr:hypothetical protein [Chthonomonadaceae bacterium]